MGKNPREPKAVKKLISNAEARLAKKTPVKPPKGAANFTSASLWAKIRLRKPGSGGK